MTSQTQTFEGHSIYTLASGSWRVGVLGSDNNLYLYDAEKYASEASATLAAKRAHHAKPFLNYVAVRA